eukprot:2011263-Prymnesium_polylepis.1
MELNSAAPPDGLVRWYCFDENDAGAGNTVRNHAAHGPERLDMKTGSGDGDSVSAEDAKPKWTTRKVCGETDEQ